MNEYWLGIATLAGIYLIATLGVSILTGFTGLFSMGHAGFMCIGAYVSAIIAKLFGVPFYIGLFCGVIASVLIGLLIGYATLRLRGDYFVITTLALGEIVKLTVENLTSITGGAKGMPDVPAGTTFPLVLILDIVIIILLINFLKSKHGRNCIAIREEEMASKVIGIDVMKYKLVAMAISCALCGLAGGLMAHFMHYLHPIMFNMVKSNELIMMVILGGTGSLTGTIIATVFLVYLPEVLRVGAAQEWRMFIYGVLVVIVIIFKPSGLLGNKEFRIIEVKKLFIKLSQKISPKTQGGNKNV